MRRLMAIFQLRTIDGSYFFKGHFLFIFVFLIVGPFCRSLFLLWECCVWHQRLVHHFHLAATHRFACIFCPSASPSPCLKPPGDANWTAQYSTAGATSARLINSPLSCVMPIALDTSPSDLLPGLLTVCWM